jgi:hypothetical protein
MAFTLEKLKKAREAGYSDEEILSVASGQNPKIGDAIKSGYSLDEVADYYSTGPMAQSISEQEQVQNIRQVPEAINQGKGLPVGGEPMVTGPDILAQEKGQTKTFMEDAQGKPVEVRRAQAIDIGGRVIEEPISPDGMALDFRGNLIKEKTKELQSASGLPYSEYIQKSNTLRSELSKLQEAQQKHEANQLGFLSKLITEKPRLSVDVETGLGEERVTGAEGKITSVPIETRRSAAIKQIGDQRQFIDNIIGNDKFLDYIKTKGIDTPGMMSRMAGQYLNVGEAPDKIAQLKQNPEVRKLAEEWAMTTPDFMDTATDIFKRAYDGYAGAVGSGTIGPIGMLLKEVGFEQSGQSLIEAAEYADKIRLLGQDPRKVGALAQFGRDVSGGVGYTIAAITFGRFGNAARASLGLNSARAINLFQKANTLTFGGLNSAWAGYSEAKSDGATEEQANQAALFSALTQAPLELVSPLQKWISRFDGAQQQRIYKGLNRAAQAVIEGTEEALFNEMPQQIAGNLVKKYVYDPNQDIFEGTLYAGGVGGASGVMASIFTQMIGGKRAKNKALQGDQEGSEETDIESQADAMADQLAPDAVSDLAQQMTAVSGEIDNLKEEIANDEMGLQGIEKTAPEYQAAELALNEKKTNLAQLQTQFNKLSAGPAEVKTETPVASPATPTATKEAAIAKIDELNKEFDALDENDQVGINRVNEAIAVEQNKLAELTAIEQGVEPQGTTPTREMGLPPSGRRSEFGTFFPDRPVLQAFVKATDKVLGGIKATGKRAQKLKNAIRTGIAANAGFLAGTNTEVISSEEYAKLTGGKQVAADTGTYRATFLNGKKYLVVPNINQLSGISIQGEQRTASRDAALDQESRATAKKLEEEMIHLSMFQGIQDEYKGIKNPKFSEQEYIVKRISDIAQEVKRTNPNALPGVSEVYLNEKNKNLDDLTFSQEFMRMVIQRVRTGQITEDLNAIRQAEQEAFSDQDKGLITAWKNSILNALEFARNSIARYLGKGTSTKEVKKMEDTINNILDEYGIVKGEANYEFKDYSSAQPKGELKAEPTQVTPTTEESLPVEAVSETITETVEAKAGVTPQMDADYLAAVESGDMETAQRMVDEASGNKETVYRGQKGYQTQYPKSTKGFFGFGKNIKATFFSSSPYLATDYSRGGEYKGETTPSSKAQLGTKAWRYTQTLDTYSGNKKIGKRKFTNVTTNESIIDDLKKEGAIVEEIKQYPSTPTVQSAKLFFKNPLVVDAKGSLWNKINFNNTTMSSDEIAKYAFDNGYDGVEIQNVKDSFSGLRADDVTTDYISFYPEQVKSADPVTYDEQGNVIPLSERFDVTSPIIARAGVTPEGEPISKRGQGIMQKITTKMISDLEAQAEMLKPKNNKAYTEYQSRAAQKDKKWNKALLSPFSIAANLFTSNSFTAANNALDKIFRNNPDADFFSVAQNLAGMDEATAQRAYNISPYERLVLMEMMYELSSVYRKEVMDSNMKATARESFALESIDVEAGLARNIALTLRESGRMVQAAAALRKLVGAGMAIDTYKRNIIASMGNLSAVTRSSFNEVANAIRGDRRKSMDKVFNTQEVFRKAASLIKMAQRNPEKVRQSIRAEVSKKQTESTRQILLDFAAGLFDTKEDKYANMVVDQTVQNILSIGMNKKEFSIDNVTKFMYQSFAAAAKQLGIQQAGIEKQKAGKRSGKYLEMVKAVIGNDNAYKSFLNDLANRMAEKYQSRDAFNADFAELFKALRSNEWADKLRTQAIKDSADFLNYKFNDLFTYLGSQRNVNQEAVKQHIRTELQGTGASNELIEKFIQDTDKYLNEQTNEILQDKLGFRIDEKTGKVSPKPLMSAKIQEEAQAQFLAIKNLKDISKLSTSDYGNFKENLISRIITEVGMDQQNATELATLISKQMEKAMLAQRSDSVDKAIKKAQEVLADNKIKSTANQRTILQKLIEMANTGILDSEMVYEAFRQTHSFPKSFMPYDSEFANSIREWGDRISKLPAGVIRSIEEEKMGRALMSKSKFTAGDVLSSYWYFSLISQASTSAINAMAGANNLIANVAVWSIYNPKSFFPMMRAMYSAVAGKNSAAVNSFLYVMRNGLNPSGMQDERRAKYPKTNVLEGATPENVPKIVYYLTNFGDGKINFLPDWMNTLLKNFNPRQMMRLLKATDMFLREVAYEAKAAQLGAKGYSKEGFNIAKRQAELELASSQSKGKQKDQEILIRANEIYREQRLNDEKKQAIAEQDALETVFNQDPAGFFGLLANSANAFLARYPATKFVVPFTNVVANVTNEFINYTPIFSQIRLMGAIKKGVNDPFTFGRGDKQWEMGIKGMLGYVALVVPLIIQALQSGDEEDQQKRPYIQLYSEGPRDPRQKKIWQQRGGQKYSVRVGDTYYSYLATPLVIPLAMAATTAEEYQLYKKKGEKLQEKDWGKLAATMLTAPFSIGFVAVLNQSFLSGVADLLEFKDSQNIFEKGGQFAGGIISRMAVPGAFRDINKLFTEEKAVGGDYLSNFLKEMPGSIKFLDKDVGYFGDPIQFPSAVREEGFGKRLASVFGRIVSTEKPDPAWEVMYKNNLTPPAWDASLSWDNGFRMTKKEELEFIRTAGPRMRDAIVENADDLDSLPLDEAQTLLSNIVAAERRGAKDDLQDSLNIPIDIE